MTDSSTPRVALISAVAAAIPPAQAALNSAFEAVEVWNLLDDRLLSDADAAGSVTPHLQDRMRRLIAHAHAEGADAVLLTCSLYGEVARSFESDIPVLSPDESALIELRKGGYKSIAVVASFSTALEDSLNRLNSAFPVARTSEELWGIVPRGLAEAATSDPTQAAALIAKALHQESKEFDAVFLAQYSIAPAGVELSRTLGLPVISGPASAANYLRQVIVS